MYLIHFNSKNIIKIHFQKSCVFKVSKPLQPLNFIQEEEKKDHSTQNCMHYNAIKPDLKIYIYIILYIVQNFDRFSDKKNIIFF